MPPTPPISCPTIAELIDALPVAAEQEPSADEQLRELLLDLARRPVPTGRLTGLWSLGTLQAKIAAAYLAWWIRSSYGEVLRRRSVRQDRGQETTVRHSGELWYHCAPVTRSTGMGGTAKPIPADTTGRSPRTRRT
jgi:hypothetical protein